MSLVSHPHSHAQSLSLPLSPSPLPLSRSVCVCMECVTIACQLSPCPSTLSCLCWLRRILILNHVPRRPHDRGDDSFSRPTRPSPCEAGVRRQLGCTTDGRSRYFCRDGWPYMRWTWRRPPQWCSQSPASSQWASGQQRGHTAGRRIAIHHPSLPLLHSVPGAVKRASNADEK